MLSFNYCDNGKEQSPINIDTSKTLECTKTLCDLSFYYRISNLCEIRHHVELRQDIIDEKTDIIKESEEGNIKQGSEYIIVDMKKTNSFVIYNLIRYNLDKVTFNTPSLHTVNDQHADGEMLLYHSSPSGNILVISVLITINDKVTVSSQFYDMFMHYLPKRQEYKLIDMTGKNWNIFYGLPKNKDFYSYEGSLIQGKPTSKGYEPSKDKECKEGVTWLVLKYPVNINQVAYDRLTSINNPKHKPLKKLFDRTVYFTSNNNIYNFKSAINNCKKVHDVIKKNSDKIKQSDEEIDQYCLIHKKKDECNDATLETIEGICKWEDKTDRTLNDFDDNVAKKDINETLMKEEEKLEDSVELSKKKVKEINEKNKEIFKEIISVIITIVVVAIIGFIIYYFFFKKKGKANNLLSNNIDINSLKGFKKYF